MKLILIRHGETEVNVVGNTHIVGDTARLTELGKDQISKTADRLQSMNIGFLASSSEARAIESANILREKLSIDTEEFEEFNERNWGKLSGKPWSEIASILDPMSLGERYNFVPENGESWKQFEDRLKLGIDKLIDTKQPNVVLVAHGGTIRAMIPLLLDLPKEESFKYSPDNASISIFESKDDKFEMTSYNDTSHLD